MERHNISEEHTASIFGAKGGEARFLRISGVYIQDHTALPIRRQTTSFPETEVS
jgi:hypothetical protein